MTFRRTLLSALFATLVAGPASAAGSLDEGVANLAGQIVQKTLSDDTVTIGITTFPHADNSCSELSNYLADLLVVSLFDVGQGKVQIVERAQLIPTARFSDSQGIPFFVVM